MLNAAHEYLDTIRRAPKHFDSYCHTLSFQVMTRLAKNSVDAHMLWMRHDVDEEHLFPSTISRYWRFHAAVEIDGMVHDAWFPEVLPRDEYLRRMFPDQPVRCFVGRWDWDTIYKQTATPKYAAACCDCESCRANWVD